MMREIAAAIGALLNGTQGVAGVSGAMALAPWIVLAAGLFSAALYARRRRLIDALLVTIAALCLSLVLAQLRLPEGAAAVVPMATDANGVVSEAALLAAPAASGIALSGDGLREAEWRDLPARPLQWKPSDADLLDLEFPRTLTLGRIFTLTVHRSQPKPGWRLQLLAENKQVLAESPAGARDAPPQLTVQWLPPVAEAMVLQARLLDAAGTAIAQGPVPLLVTEQVPLQIQGRFEAPSFDARALNQLLTDGSAILDWQITLGKAIARSETARAAMPAPNAMFADAAYIEHLAPPARAALLAQVAQGLPLVVLGSSAADSALWQREFGLRLRAQPATTEKEDTRQFNVNGNLLALPPAALNPEEGGEPWSVLARDSRQRPWLWQRGWKLGRVVWIGVADWHRYAISAPQALALWWQSAMDLIALGSRQANGWLLPDPMPLPGLRSELCVQGGVQGGAQGGSAGALLRVDGVDTAGLALQARADRADALCAAFWPQKSGWLHFSGGGVAQPGQQYIYSKSDWPAWQQSLRRAATAQYAVRNAEPRRAAASTAAAGGRPMPDAPLVLLFAAGMLLLWWREQR